MELTVYKTGPLKKWAVRTNSSMKAWTFVLEYLGVVRRCEGETSQENFPYVFELEAGEREQPNFVVDSSQRSNVCRFINHSVSAISFLPMSVQSMCKCDTITDDGLPDAHMQQMRSKKLSIRRHNALGSKVQFR